MDPDGLPPLDQLPGHRLVDHHCHPVVRRDLDRLAFEALLTEAHTAGPAGASRFDSRIGFAVRRWCAPVLGLARHANADAYLARRRELGTAEVTRLFLRGAGLAGLCVDTGYAPEPLLGLAALAEAAGAPAYEVVRLEAVAEECAAEEPTATAFAERVRARLARRCTGAVAVKSIAAYRAGLDLDGRRPTDAEVAAAAGRWFAARELTIGVPAPARDTAREQPTGVPAAAGTPRTGRGAAPVRLADEVLHRFLIWTGVDLGLPTQVHVGYGDRDLDLRRADPLRLTGLLRAIEPTGVPVLLLHNYPYHRQAGYLAQVFDHVFVDVGLAAHNVGDRATALLAEVLELAPFGKVLYSSDAYGLPELYYLGARLFRRALHRVLSGGVAADDWSPADAARVAGLIASDNARRVYGLPPTV